MTNHNVMYGKAPYNFVPLPEKIVVRYQSKNELPTHDASKEEDIHLLSGEITFNIVAQNPILVSDESKPNEPRTFNRNADGIYEIPGSSLRGVIRNVASILSLSDWTEQVDDERFFYRDVAGPSKTTLKRHYNSLLGIVSNKEKKASEPKEVKAGYIVKVKNDEYVIYPAKSGSGRHGKTYYKVTNRDVTIKKDEFIRNVREGFIVQNNVKFSLDQYGKVVKLFHDDGSFTGHLLYSGFIKNKNGDKIVDKVSAYLINEIDTEKEPLHVDLRDIKAFNADLKFRLSKFPKKGGEREKRKAFFKLPEKIGIQYAKPCFYIVNNGVTYFGFTAFLRLLFPYSTKDLLPEHILNKPSGIDYASALFGFTDNEGKSDGNKTSQQGSYASRLHFHSALIKSDVEPLKPVNILPGSPRASAYRFYLNQEGIENNNAYTYLTNNTTIRGMKQYWIKEVDVPFIEGNKGNTTQLKLLPKNTIFQAKITFDQLHKDELGLLLWALKGPKYHQIGMGKPYGYGVAKFENIECFVTNNEKMYKSLTNFFDIGQEKIDTDSYIEAFKAYMINHKENGLQIEALEELESIQTFLAMKDKSKLEKKYMQYTNLKGYSKTVLPSAKQLLNNGNAFYQQQEANHANKRGKSNYWRNGKKPYQHNANQNYRK